MRPTLSLLLIASHGYWAILIYAVLSKRLASTRFWADQKILTLALSLLASVVIFSRAEFGVTPPIVLVATVQAVILFFCWSSASRMNYALFSIFSLVCSVGVSYLVDSNFFFLLASAALQSIAALAYFKYSALPP